MYGENIRTKDNAVITEDIAQDASKCQNYISKILSDRWKRFSKIYLNELRQNYINRQQKYSSNFLKVGFILIIKGE